MKTSLPALHLAGGFLGFLAMAAVGWNLADIPPPSVPAAEVPATRRDSRPARSQRLSGPASAAAKRMEAVRSAATPEARMRATIDLASSLPPSEFAAWMEGGYFNLRGGADLTVFSKILMARWMLEDPEGLLAWSIKNDTSQSRSILATWTEKEPQRVIDFFKNHPNEEEEMRALWTIAKDHPDLALQRLRELAAGGLSRQVLDYTSGLFFSLAEKSPAALEAALASLPPALQKQAENALIGQQLKASFSTGIRALWDRPDGWVIFERNAQQNRGMGAKIFDELANMPPAWRASLASTAHHYMDEASSLQWLDADLEGFGFSAAQAKQLRSAAFDQLADRQPEQAFKRMGEMELDPDRRRNIISNALSSVSDDPEKAAGLIALLDSEDDRKIARGVLDANPTREEIAKLNNPADWLEKLSTIDPELDNSYSHLSSLEQWDQDKLSELNSQFQKMPADKKQSVARMIAANYRYGSVDPVFAGAAIRYLVENPVAVPENGRGNDANPVVASSAYAVRLAVRDPFAAADWVETLPAGDAKLWAQKNLAKNWAQYDPKAVTQWLGTLPAEARGEVETFMKKRD